MEPEQEAPRKGWEFERKVSLTLVIAVVANFIIGGRWIGSVEGEQTELNRRVTTLEVAQIDAKTDHTKIAVLEATLAQLQKQVDETRTIVDEIRTLLIQERGGTPKGK